MRFCFDIDGTLCTNTHGAYETAQPLQRMIDQVNALYDAGHFILLFTARGSTTGIDWRAVTEEQMTRWGVRYHELRLGKPEADIFIDDRGKSIDEWFADPPPAVAPMLKALPNPDAPPLPETATTGRWGEYLDVVYAADRKPQSDYPLQLATLLADRVGKRNGRLLDVGCGRGDMMRAFASLGFETFGTDISPASPELCQPLPVRVDDLEQGDLPYPPESFDLVFSKSVVEHVRRPLSVLQKAFDALKPGGVAVIMTPSWMHNAWGPFYIDFTHVTPFTQPSLRDALAMTGFEGVAVEHFHQLPFLWKYPALTPLVRLLARLPIPYRPMMPGAPWPDEPNKLIRFSKEVMLLAIARKPLGPQA